MSGFEYEEKVPATLHGYSRDMCMYVPQTLCFLHIISEFISVQYIPSLLFVCFVLFCFVLLYNYNGIGIVIIFMFIFICCIIFLFIYLIK